VTVALPDKRVSDFAGIQRNFEALAKGAHGDWRAASFLVYGEVDAALTVPPALVRVRSTQTVRLVEVRAQLLSGTSVDVTPRVNGASLAAITALSTSWTADAHDISLDDLDELDFTVASPTGTPTDLSVVFTLESIS
jgi:hypothetical protein